MDKMNKMSSMKTVSRRIRLLTKSMKDKIATEKDRIAIGINKHH